MRIAAMGARIIAADDSEVSVDIRQGLRWIYFERFTVDPQQQRLWSCRIEITHLSGPARVPGSQRIGFEEFERHGNFARSVLSSAEIAEMSGLSRHQIEAIQRG